jgi:predicted transcriptional regulator
MCANEVGDIAMAHGSITIRTDPELEEKLTQLAAAMDRSRNWIVNQALRAYIDEQTWFIEQVKEGLTSLDRGEGIPHEEVMAEMDGLIETKLKEAER